MNIFKAITFLLCATLGLSQTVPLRNPQIQGSAGTIISGATLGNNGTINGSGVYGFILTVIDGQVTGGNGVDRFRIKIVDKLTGNMVYDNMLGASDGADPTTAIEGGSIIIHKVK